MNATALLADLHYAIDGGDVNESARLVYKIRKIEGALTSDEAEWFADLLHIHCVTIGGFGGRA